MMATRVRSMLQACIYEKSLRLHDASANVPPVTLMQVDTGKVEDLTYSLHTLWDGDFVAFGDVFLISLQPKHVFFPFSFLFANLRFGRTSINDPVMTSTSPTYISS